MRNNWTGPVLTFFRTTIKENVGYNEKLKSNKRVCITFINGITKYQYMKLIQITKKITKEGGKHVYKMYFYTVDIYNTASRKGIKILFFSLSYLCAYRLLNFLLPWHRREIESYIMNRWERKVWKESSVKNSYVLLKKEKKISLWNLRIPITMCWLVLWNVHTTNIKIFVSNILVPYVLIWKQRFTDFKE